MGLPESWIDGIQQWADSKSIVREVWLFGSRARGDHEDSADVDLALTLTPPTGLPGRIPTDWASFEFGKKRSAWKAELERIVGRDVDLEVVCPQTSQGRLSGGEMTKPKGRVKHPPSMAKVLLSVFADDSADVYAAFLRDRAHDHDHGFLLSAVRRSNLHPAVKAVLSELIQGKLKRPAYRPVSAKTEMRDMQRALLVLDKEAGGDRRKAAVSKTAAELKCGIRTVEKALAEQEEVLKGANSKDRAWIRAYRN